MLLFGIAVDELVQVLVDFINQHALRVGITLALEPLPAEDLCKVPGLGYSDIRLPVLEYLVVLAVWADLLDFTEHLPELHNKPQRAEGFETRYGRRH